MTVENIEKLQQGYSKEANDPVKELSNYMKTCREKKVLSETRTIGFPVTRTIIYIKENIRSTKPDCQVNFYLSSPSSPSCRIRRI